MGEFEICSRVGRPVFLTRCAQDFPRGIGVHRRVECTSSMRAAPERSLGAVSVASAPCKGFSQRDLPSTRYAHNPSTHMMRQGTTLKTMDARLSATNQCHRNTTPATARTVSTTTHPRRLNITLQTLSMPSRHHHEYFRRATIRGDLIDRDRLGTGPRHAGQVSRHTRHTRNGNADNLRPLRQELADRINWYVADYDIATDE